MEKAISRRLRRGPLTKASGHIRRSHLHRLSPVSPDADLRVVLRVPPVTKVITSLATSSGLVVAVLVVLVGAR